MKKSIILGICCMIAANTTFAQTEDPKGLYRLQKLSYEDGRPDHIPEFAQYKYCTDVAPFTIMIATDTPKSFEYAIRTDEPHPYTYTGNTHHIRHRRQLLQLPRNNQTKDSHF